MANFLKYDVYDLELTAVHDNSELRRLLIETGAAKKQEEKVDGGSKVTFSGLLNFIDGIWPSCGRERVIVCTTNYVEKLDPALVRRGRMDKHIEMSYCTFEGFQVLVNNYLLVEKDDDYHGMFDEVKSLLSEVNVTPADVAENLMPKNSEENAEKCIRKLIAALEAAKKKKNPVIISGQKSLKLGITGEERSVIRFLKRRWFVELELKGDQNQWFQLPQEPKSHYLVSDCHNPLHICAPSINYTLHIDVGINALLWPIC